MEQILKSFESILHHPTLNFEFDPASESDVTQLTDQPGFSNGGPRFLSLTPINQSAVDFLRGPPFFELVTNQPINRTFGTDTQKL